MLVLPENTPSYEVARAMSEKFVGCALVSDGKGRITGIVTDRDLACGILGEKLPSDSPISEVMARDLKIIYEGEKISKVLQIMQRYGVRRVPVMRKKTGGSQYCVGIYTLDDFIIWGEVPLKDLRAIVKKQMYPIKRKTLLSDRKSSRKEQTLFRFNKIISKEMLLERDLAERVIFFLLKTLVQRAPAHVAVNFIAELPSLIQEDLLDTTAGPNKKLTKKSIEEALMHSYGLGKETVARIMEGFWRGLSMTLKQGALKQLTLSLPKDLQLAFMPSYEKDFLKVQKKIFNSDIRV